MTDSRNQNAIEVRGLRKSFGRTLVLRGLDFEVRWGEVVTIIGDNGSGKTTLLRVLATLSGFDAGSVRIGGLDVKRSGKAIRRAIGVVTHDPLLYDDLTARENLKFYSRMYGVERSDERIAEVVGQMGMLHRLDDRVRTLSHGMKKRISIARALLHAPRILIMDEPESGLDRDSLTMLDGVIESFKDSSRAVVMTTHNPERVAEISDRTEKLSRGQITHE
jgi:heme ABC exporter ATP-binding subunit CcmA